MAIVFLKSIRFGKFWACIKKSARQGAYGKVTDVKQNGSNNQKAKYFYGPGGQRLKKNSYDAFGLLTKETWYVGGMIYERPLGVGTGALKEVPIIGAGRVGEAHKNQSINFLYYYRYELRDHLGIVRAVIRDNGSNG